MVTYKRVFRAVTAAAAAIFLLAVLPLAPPAAATGSEAPSSGSADAAEAAPGVYRLDITHSIRIDLLDKPLYMLRESCLAFAVGKTGESVEYLATDAAALNGSEALAGAAEDIQTLLAQEGLFMDPDEFLGDIEITGTEITVSDGGQHVAAEPTYLPSGSGVAVLKLGRPLADAAPLPLDGGAEGDAASAFRLSGDFAPVLMSDGDSFSGSAEISAAPATELSAQPDRTMLGSPTLDGEGGVLRIVVWDSERGNATTVPSSALASALDEQDIPYESAASAGTSSPRGLWMIGSVALAAIVLVAVLLIIKARRNIRAMARAESAAEADDIAFVPLRPAAASTPPVGAARRAGKTAPAASRRSMVVPESAPVAVAEKTPAPAAPRRPIVVPESAPVAVAERESAPAAPAPTMLLAVLGGSRQGCTLNVRDSALIGRDPAVCAMVFPAEDTEISRRHCRVTFLPDELAVLVEDLGSQNGTYLSDGRRLVQGRAYRLKNGGRFYLGLSKNMLEIRM